MQVARIGALAVALAIAPAAARADGLTAEETERLATGATVIRLQTVETGSRRLVGGITYTVVESTPEELLSLFEDTGSWPSVLPRTRSARLVERHGRDRLVELVQGNALVMATYTIRLRHTPEERTVRFWLDPSRPHSLDDAWGFFRAQPLPPGGDGRPRTLLTFACLVDLGPGLARALFEERIRSTILGVPQLVRERVRRASGAGRPAELSETPAVR
jgi:hypothetical protein